MKKILIGIVGLVIVASLAFLVLVGNLEKSSREPSRALALSYSECPLLFQRLSLT